MELRIIILIDEILDVIVLDFLARACAGEGSNYMQ